MSMLLLMGIACLAQFQPFKDPWLQGMQVNKIGSPPPLQGLYDLKGYTAVCMMHSTSIVLSSSLRDRHSIFFAQRCRENVIGISLLTALMLRSTANNLATACKMCIHKQPLLSALRRHAISSQCRGCWSLVSMTVAITAWLVLTASAWPLHCGCNSNGLPLLSDSCQYS